MAKSVDTSTTLEGSRPASGYTPEKMMVEGGFSRSTSDQSGKDVEKASGQVERKLKSRHLQMIAIGTLLQFQFYSTTNMLQVAQLVLVSSSDLVVQLPRQGQQVLSLPTPSSALLSTAS